MHHQSTASALTLPFPPIRLARGLLAACAVIAGLASAWAQSSSVPLAVTTLAGQAGTSGYADGSGSVARFLNPSGLVVDSKGNLFIADSGNNTIRKITPAGVVTTFAGIAVDPDTGVAGNGGTADGAGGAAQFSFGKAAIDNIGSTTLAIDINDNLYVADTLNSSIRKLTPTASVTTLVLKDAVTGVGVSLNSPDAVAVDTAGNLYVTDSGLNQIRKITPAGAMSILAGSTNPNASSGSADGTGTAATFNNPRGIAVDSAGNVYVADTNNHTIRKITAAGVVTTFAGSAGTPIKNSAGNSDGIGKNARFNTPIGLSVDASGNLYVADKGNNAVRKITSSGVVSTLAGTPGTAGSSDGIGIAARFNQPYSLTADNAGNLFVADTKNHTIRKGVVSGSTSVVQIQTQPLIQIVRVGQSTTFTIGATGTPGPTYQWQKNGVNISGATSASYILASPQLADDRTYYAVIVTSGNVSLTSSAAQLQVYPASVFIPPIIILNQPTDLVVTAGQSATLSIDASGSPLPTYQWQKNGVSIAGATGADYTINSAQAADGGIYKVILSSSGTTQTSNEVGLTVVAAVVTPVAIVSQPNAQTINLGQNVTFAVQATGNPLPTYQWQKNGANISGATSPSYAITSAQAGDAGNFRVIVTNSAGSVTSTQVALTVITTVVSPVAITSQPVAQTVTVGQNATFTVQATGTTPGYQWQKNGATIPGATNASYTIADAQSSDAGDYRVVITNSANSVTSSAVTLTVNVPVPVITNPGRLINLSVLAPISSAGDNFTLGYVVNGASATNAKPLVIRAAGPSLGALGVGGTLADPQLELFAGPTKTGGNDDWGGSNQTAAAMAAVGAFAYTGATSRDAAVAASITSRDNSVKISASPNASTGTGIVIAEVYDATPAASFDANTPRLINFSVLKNVTTKVTLGFVIGGGTNKTVLIRAIGPTLGIAPFNVGGAIPDPKVELFNGASISIGTNDNWAGTAELTAAFIATGAFALSATSKDAALITTLVPGNYTVEVTPATGTAGGTALLEVYDVPNP